MSTTTTTAPFVTFHALQAFGPSLLNRDDADATKQIVYGGVPRVRVSAQAWRRPLREKLREAGIEGATYAIRTNILPQLIAQELVALGRPEDVATVKASNLIIGGMGFKPGKKGATTTAVQIVVADAFVGFAAELIDGAWDEIGDTIPAEVVKAANGALDITKTIDGALFGRMLTEKDDGRVDGAAGVAHAISVDAAAIEPDFWTAVDDKAPADEPSSSNIGTSMVSAPTVYRVASLDRNSLRSMLEGCGHTVEAAEAGFAEAFIESVPSAKQRSSVAATQPSLVVAVSGAQALSAANAFVVPIEQSPIIEASKALLALLERVTGASRKPYTITILCLDPALDEILAGYDNVHRTIESFTNAVAEA